MDPQSQREFSARAIKNLLLKPENLRELLEDVLQSMRVA